LNNKGAAVSNRIQLRSGCGKIATAALSVEADAEMGRKQIPPQHAHPVQQKWQQPNKFRTKYRRALSTVLDFCKVVCIYLYL